METIISGGDTAKLFEPVDSTLTILTTSLRNTLINQSSTARAKIDVKLTILDANARKLLMFIDELTPIWQQFTQHPVSFMGGFFSGVLRLNLADDPVKSWLSQQIGSTTYTTSTTEGHNGKAGGPQSIAIE
jgi:hypothetical protein